MNPTHHEVSVPSRSQPFFIQKVEAIKIPVQGRDIGEIVVNVNVGKSEDAPEV